MNAIFIFSRTCICKAEQESLLPSQLTYSIVWCLVSTCWELRCFTCKRLISSVKFRRRTCVQYASSKGTALLIQTTFVIPGFRIPIVIFLHLYVQHFCIPSVLASVSISLSHSSIACACNLQRVNIQAASPVTLNCLRRSLTVID